VVPHDKDKDNPSELIRGKDVAAFGLWSLPSFDTNLYGQNYR
jgi:flagellar assembly protein FliH